MTDLKGCLIIYFHTVFTIFESNKCSLSKLLWTWNRVRRTKCVELENNRKWSMQNFACYSISKNTTIQNRLIVRNFALLFIIECVEIECVKL